ncbi:LapA family protein [Jidongwangia harbinensis]|uniref:LapA family protein n=1 Tax=Jidongwangia harbinensis TaxID=2878561 RepID=UPI001CDA2CD6|nr:lipopolysaccharide assembly protein LapA domain-containing protein [Jidongwangia harbinensis]MCA2216732.1 lipopolysaccharide assembly protein LapA domain-containing protein [Jidongwangia harbinensis]
MTYASDDRPTASGTPVPAPESTAPEPTGVAADRGPSGVPLSRESSGMGFDRESSGVTTGREPAGVAPAGDRAPGPRVTHTRTSAVWAGVWAGVVALIVLIVFIAQNTAKVEISFFALEGRIPLALALLIAGVAGAIVAMAVAAARIIQLRRLVRRNH